MNTSNEQRKLAAIMFTDMVGYSVLAQRNQSLALELLEEHRALLRPLFPKFNGTEIKTIGDAFLVEFQSALEAAQCAIEIQRTLAKRNHDVPSGRRIELKIGIHIGDVVHRDGDVYGDGVNIASRIEPLAGAGGICVSMDVERQVRAALEARFEKLAPTELKNISLAMDLFRIVLPWEKESGRGPEPPLPARGRRAAEPGAEGRPGGFPARAGAAAILVLVLAAAGIGWWLTHPAGRAAKPAAGPATNNAPSAPATSVPAISQKSIAVLPFANMSQDKENAFFADGIHEDLLTTLGMVHDLHVVSRTSVEQYRETTKSMRQIGQELGVAYVLEGSVRRAGNEVRVTGQLIRSATDEHVWAKSYDRDLTNIFSLQSELATEIANELSAVISPQEKTLIDRRPTDNPEAYDLFLKARAVLKNGIVFSTRAEAEQNLEAAVKLDPNFAAAWGYLALAHVRAVISDEDHSPGRLARARAAIDTAVRLAPDDPDVIEMEGDYYYYGYRDYARAAEQYQRLLRLRPNSADAYAYLGYISRRQGHWAEALANLRFAAQLDPRNVSILEGLAEVLMSLDRYDEAYAQARRAAELDGGNLLVKSFPFLVLYSSTGATGEGDEWLAKVVPEPAQTNSYLFLRQAYARARGDWAQAVRIGQQASYVDPINPRSTQQLLQVIDLIGAGDLPAARSLAEKLAAEFKSQLEQQPDNSTLWANLGTLQAVLGDKVAALISARKAVTLVPESADAIVGASNSYSLAVVKAWTGDKDGALNDLARLLRTPYGANVHSARTDPGWQPLHGDPRFEALLKDPANNAPLLADPAVVTPLP